MKKEMRGFMKGELRIQTDYGRFSVKALDHYQPWNYSHISYCNNEIFLTGSSFVRKFIYV